MPELHAAAPAKINLVLEVLGRRDDGYHELRTVMQKLACGDEVGLTWERAPGVTLEGSCIGDTPADETNLAWRAAAALRELSGHEGPMPHITITKRVPPASGLGGGASDAATTLQLLAKAWEIADASLLLNAANSVGSDEAFFLGGPSALVSGRGDMVEPLAPLPQHGVVLFIPDIPMPNKTASLFKALSGIPFDDGSRTAAYLKREGASLGTDDTFNAFERVAFEVFPGLGELRARLQSAIGESVRLSGAGPTLFWIGASAQVDEIARRAGTPPGVQIVVTTTLT